MKRRSMLVHSVRRVPSPKASSSHRISKPPQLYSSTLGASALVTDTTVMRADAPRVLEYNWGGFDMRWELEAFGDGTRLTLWTNIDRRFIAMGAAGWHVYFDVLDHLLSGTPIGRIVGPEAMKFGGWQRLHAEYAKQFGVVTSGWPTNTPKRKNPWN